MQKPRFLLLIPAYNCAPQITRVLESVVKNCYCSVSEILLMDNRSNDRTLDRALRFKKKHVLERLTIVKNVKNYGLGGSHKLAIRYAETEGYDYLIVLHGDNQADPAEVENFIGFAKQNPQTDAILGTRFSRQSTLDGYSIVRTVGNYLVNGVYSLGTGRLIKDLGSGLNCFKVSKLSSFDYSALSDGCDFNVELLLQMIRNQWELDYLPISWREEDQQSNINAVKFGLDCMKILGRWRMGRNLQLPIDMEQRRFRVMGANH